MIGVAAAVFARNGPIDAHLKFGFLRIIDGRVVQRITRVRQISSTAVARGAAACHPPSVLFRIVSSSVVGDKERLG